MPWSRWIEHDGDGAAHDRLIGRYIRVESLFESAEGVLPPRSHEVSAFDWYQCQERGWWNMRVLRYRVWSDELPSFDVTRIDADRPMEPAE